MIRKLVVSVAIATVLVPASFAQPAAALKIDMSRAKSPVSPTLYGLMTEEINYSYDGGLYAELVRNRTFRSDWSGILNWFLVEKGSSSAKISVDAKDGPSTAINNSAKLEVTKADANSPAGLINEGYWGMAVRPNTRYTGSLFAKSGSEGSLPVKVALVADTSGQVLASASVPVAGQRVEGVQVRNAVGQCGGLGRESPGDYGRQARDALAATRFGLPADLSQPGRTAIASTLWRSWPRCIPRSCAFPGGNYLEGGRIETRFDWKKMIGPMVDRPTHPTTWSYHSSDGMGLLEFLKWCEDLHMEPVLGVYAGYSLGGQVVKPGPDLDLYVQEALEEIEYVTGGAETKWGAVRAKAGIRLRSSCATWRSAMRTTSIARRPTTAGSRSSSQRSRRSTRTCR